MTYEQPKKLSAIRHLICPHCDGHVFFWGFPSTGLISYAACEDCNETIFFPPSPLPKKPTHPPPDPTPEHPRCHGCGTPLTPSTSHDVHTIYFQPCPSCGRRRIIIYADQSPPPPHRYPNRSPPP